MNTQKSVYNRLFSESKKTELETHKVELGLIDDLKKYSQVSDRANKTIQSDSKKVKKLQSEIRTVLTEVNASSNALTEVLKELKNDLNKFEKAASDLGIKAEQSKEYVAAKNSIKDIEKAKKLADDIYESGKKNFL